MSLVELAEKYYGEEEETYHLTSMIWGKNKTISYYEALANTQLQYPDMDKISSEHFVSISSLVEFFDENMDEIIENAYEDKRNYGERLFSAYLIWPLHFDVISLYKRIRKFLPDNKKFLHIDKFLKQKLFSVGVINDIMMKQAFPISEMKLSSIICEILYEIPTIRNAINYLSKWYSISQRTFYTNLPEMIIETLTKGVPKIPEKWMMESSLSLEERIYLPESWYKYDLYFPKVKVNIDMVKFLSKFSFKDSFSKHRNFSDEESILVDFASDSVIYDPDMVFLHYLSITFP